VIPTQCKPACGHLAARKPDHERLRNHGVLTRPAHRSRTVPAFQLIVSRLSPRRRPLAKRAAISRARRGCRSWRPGHPALRSDRTSISPALVNPVRCPPCRGLTDASCAWCDVRLRSATETSVYLGCKQTVPWPPAVAKGVTAGLHHAQQRKSRRGAMRCAPPPIAVVCAGLMDLAGTDRAQFRVLRAFRASRPDWRRS